MPLFRAPRTPARSPRTPGFEPLEARMVLFAATGYEWADPNVSFSFIPQAAIAEGYSNTLFSKLDSIAPTEVWQREFARALQTWANVSNLNFHQVSDNGDPSGSSSIAQDNGRFGDIRLGAHALDGPLAYAYYPVDYNDLGGDIFIDPKFNYQVGSGYDLYSVLLHEAGHAIGLGHTGGTVMNSSYQGVLNGLSADDIAGVQSIYGARSDDAYDATSRNDSLGSATNLAIDAGGAFTITADLTSLADQDYYRVAAPSGGDGSLTLSIDVSGYSLLAPRLSIFNSGGELINAVDVGAAYGASAELVLANVAAGDVFYIQADGATSDEFGMGAYQLSADFGVSGDEGGDPNPNPDPDPPIAIPSDRYEANNSLAAATSLGRFNGSTVADVSLHSETDADYYGFSARKGGDFQISVQSGARTLVKVYDATGSVVAASDTGTLNVYLASGVQTYVSVESPTGDIDVYDLVFEKLGGGGNGNGGPKGGRGGKLEPDMYFAAEADRDLVERISRHSEETNRPGDSALPLTLGGLGQKADFADSLSAPLGDFSLQAGPVATEFAAPSRHSRYSPLEDDLRSWSEEAFSELDGDEESNFPAGALLGSALETAWQSVA